MWILMYEVYAGYDLLDFALMSAILTTTGRHAHQQVFQLALAGDLDLTLHGFLPTVFQALEQGHEFGHSDANGKLIAAFRPI